MQKSLEAITGLIVHEVTKVLFAIFLHDPISLKFGMFLLVPTLPIQIRSLSLKKLGSTYNPTCSFLLDNFSPCLGISTFLWTHPRPIHAEKISFLRNDKQICWSCKAPTKNYGNQWKSARNVAGIITRVNLLPSLGLGVIITLSSQIASNKENL